LELFRGIGSRLCVGPRPREIGPHGCRHADARDGDHVDPADLLHQPPPCRSLGDVLLGAGLGSGFVDCRWIGGHALRKECDLSSARTGPSVATTGVSAAPSNAPPRGARLKASAIGICVESMRGEISGAMNTPNGWKVSSRSFTRAFQRAHDPVCATTGPDTSKPPRFRPKSAVMSQSGDTPRAGFA
jgi:hypothetical protein